MTVLRYIEANPLRAGLVKRAGEYRWSSFTCHGAGGVDPLLDPTPAYEALGARPATRQRRGPPMSIKRRTPTNWRPSVAAARRGCLTGHRRGSSGWRGG